MPAKRHVRDLNRKYARTYSWTWTDAWDALNAYRTAKHDGLTYNELIDAEMIGKRITTYIRNNWRQHVPFETRGVRSPSHGELFMFGQERLDYPSSRKARS